MTVIIHKNQHAEIPQSKTDTITKLDNQKNFGLIITPILIRLKNAPMYCGMNKNRFRQEVRPFLTVIKIGEKGVAFHRHELDQWAENFKNNQNVPIVRQLFKMVKKESFLLSNELLKTCLKKHKLENDYQRAISISKIRKIQS